MRIGTGYDVHRLGEGLPLWLGGVLVPHTYGLIGHSDADVLLHAVCDALPKNWLSSSLIPLIIW